MSQTVGEIFLDLSLNKKGFKKDVDNLGTYAQKSIGGAFKGLGKVIGVSLGTAALGAFVKSCLDVGSNVAEVQNVVDVTFGNMSNKINDFAANAVTAFGLSELSAKQYTGTMGAMLKSMGLGTEAATNMSIEMAKLAGDIASFYNLETDEAFAKIRSGISGETEPLKQLGINLSIANLEAYALSQGITKSYNAMSQADQALLRYNYLLSVTKDAQGDFARTSDSWANQIKILKLQWQSFMATLGQVFIQFLNPVLQGLNKMLTWLNAVTKSFANMISTLTGKKAQASTTMVSDSLSSAGSAASAAIGETNGLTNSLSKTAKAAKSLMGFDELNIINTASSESDDSSGTGLTAGSAGLSTITEDIGEEQTKEIGFFGKVLEKLAVIKFDNLIISFDKLKGSVGRFTNKIWSGLQWGISNILIPLAQWSIEDYLPSWIDNFAACINLLTTSITVLSPLGQWLWDTFLTPMASFVGDGIIWVLQSITVLLNNFSSWIGNNQELVEGIAIAFGAFFVALQLVYGGLNLIHTASILLTGGIQLLTGAFAFLTSPIGLVTLAIAAVITVVVLLVKHWDQVKLAAINCWTWIQNTWKGACEWINKTVVEPIADAFKGFINGLISGFEGFVNGAINGINGIINALNSINFSIPDWVPVIGGKSFGFNLGTLGQVNLPRLADGGVIDQPTLAMVGEDGQEAVVPLRNNTEWTSQVADLLSNKMGNTVGIESRLDALIDLIRQLLDKDGNVYLMDEIVGIIGDAIDQIKSKKGTPAFYGVNR